jgi:hypothetical protein
MLKTIHDRANVKAIVLLGKCKAIVLKSAKKESGCKNNHVVPSTEANTKQMPIKTAINNSEKTSTDSSVSSGLKQVLKKRPVITDK